MELNGLVDNYVRDEILFREGVALGLVKDDPVIKRRVRQKLEVLIEEEGKPGAASDAELTAYLNKNAAKFRMPPVLSFDQVFFDPAKTGTELESAMTASLAALNKGATPESQGKGSMLPERVGKAAAGSGRPGLRRGLRRRHWRTAPVGQWIGPVRSGFGVHLVRIT